MRSLAFIRVMTLILDGKIDAAAFDDDEFVDRLAAIPDSEWSDDHEILLPWQKRVCGE